MISRVTAVFAFSLLTIATSLGWAEETYQGQVAGVGEVEVELLERGSPVFLGAQNPTASAVQSWFDFRLMWKVMP